MFENGPREIIGTQNWEDWPFVLIQVMAFMLSVFITGKSFI